MDTTVKALGLDRMDIDELLATPIPAITAELDRDTNRLTLTPGRAATIGLMLPAEVSAKKLYLELRDAATDLVLHKRPDLPVDQIGRAHV